MTAPRSAGVAHKTKADAAYDYIRERIFTGELAPDQRLTLASLAELTGLSNMPVREAVLRLEKDGLIVSTPHRDMRVAPLRAEDAGPLFQVRAALEGLAASLACDRADTALTDTLRALNAAFAAAKHAGQHSTMGDVNWQFHRRILAAADNPELTKLLDGVWAKCQRFRLGYRLIPGRSAATITEHDDIIAAFIRRDAEAARVAMTAHGTRAGIDLLRSLRQPELEGIAHGA